MTTYDILKSKTDEMPDSTLVNALEILHHQSTPEVNITRAAMIGTLEERHPALEAETVAWSESSTDKRDYTQVILDYFATKEA